jgi:ribonuclease G
MSRELVIEPTPFGARAGLLVDGRLFEVGIADRDAPSVRGLLWLGRVREIGHALDAAFVDCGLNEDGWLGARDARVLSGRARGVPIGRQLHEGQAVLVQGRRDAQGGKGPRLTGDIALTGPCLVYRPRQAGAGLSKRRAARGATAAELSAEAEHLRRIWQAIEAKARAASPPVRLYGPAEPVEQLLIEHLGDDPDRILVGDQAALVRARNYLAAWRPSLLERLEQLPGAFAASGAEEQLTAALEPVVELVGGGRLTIETTAALTAIDVDGGGRRPLEVDLEAAGEIARQLRLRRLGGTVVVDFVDLEAKRDRAELLLALRAALADDPAPVQVYPMSPLGLVQISRQRSGPSLAEQLGRACPCCGGSGRLPGRRWRCEALMRDLAGRPSGPMGAAVAPDLHDYLIGPAAATWQSFGERQGRAPVLQVDASLAPGEYRIEEAGS